MKIYVKPGPIHSGEPDGTIYPDLLARNNARALFSPTPAGMAEYPSHGMLADSDRELSGAQWVARFPTSRALEDLAEDFQSSVRDFLAAMAATGAQVRISATYRPPERAYLMRYAWDIARRAIKPGDVPAFEGVDIEWDHDSEQESVEAADAMVRGYGIVHRPALQSNHTRGTAIDMTITGIVGKTIRDANGKDVAITKLSDLYPVGESFGVKKLVKDQPHWSVDGH